MKCLVENALNDVEIAETRNDQEPWSSNQNTEDVKMLNEDECFQEIFQVFDENSGRVICKEDLKSTFSKMKEHYTEAEILSMMKNFNEVENRSPVIDFSTFKRKFFRFFNFIV